MSSHQPSIIYYNDLRTTAFPPREFIIHPWLRNAESVLLFAPTGIGKTMLTDTLALAMAGGGSFAGWTCSKPRKTVLLDGEMNIADQQERFALLASSLTGHDTAAAGRNLAIISRQAQATNGPFPNIGTPEGQAIIMEILIREKAEVFIADNLSTLADIEDENSAAAMGPILTFLLDLKRAGIATIIVHHTGKAGKTFRGSSRLSATFEIMIGLLRLPNHKPTDGAGFELYFEKFRAKADPSTQSREMHLITNEADGTTAWCAKAAESVERLQLIDTIRSCTYSSQKALAAALDISQSTLTRLKVAAIAAKEITEQEWNLCLKAAKEAPHQDDDENLDF